MQALALYVLAALAEIAGCFAFWAWFRLGRSALWLAPGMASLPNGNGIDLSIGATLVVAPQQPAGVYRGSFPVTVNLN